MIIGCLGWGSLVWDPRILPVRRPWFNDGPLLPIEFARHSGGDRITLVIVHGVAHVRSLWALFSISDLGVAKEKLAEREGINEKNIPRYIGYWSQSGSLELDYTENIGTWAAHKELDAVLWTAIPPKFDNQSGKIPSADEVIQFLDNLPLERRRYAEEYIRRAPLQIDTDYRRRIEKELNWTPQCENEIHMVVRRDHE